MATVQMNRFAAEGGRMPPVCICCGSAARQHVRHTFYYQPTWLVLFYVMLPRPLKWYLSSNPAAVVVPVCGSHGRRLKWPTYISYTLAGGLLLMVPALLAASIAGWLNLLSGLLLLALAWAIGFWMLHVLITLMTPRAEHYTTSHITLTAVSPAFAQALQTGGAGVQQGMRPLPGMGGPKTVGGMTQGMLALLIIGIGGLGFLAVCFMIGVGSYYARKSRLRQFEQMAQNPPQYQPPEFGPPSFTPPTVPNPAPWTPPVAPPAYQPPPSDVVVNPNIDPNNVTPNPAVPTPPPPPPVETTTSLPTAAELPSAASPSRYSPGSPETPWNEKGEFVFANPGNSFEPTTFPNNSSPVTVSTPLSIGDRVWVLEGGAWVSGIVKELLGATQVKVHTPPAPESFAQVHSRSAVRLARATSASASTSESEAAPAAGIGASGKRILDDPSFGESTEKVLSQIPPPGSKPVTAATPLQPGNKIWHLWGSQWYPCEVASLIGADMVKVHYFNYPSSFDEEVPRSQLRLPRGSRIVSAAAGSAPASAAANTSTDAEATAAAPSADPDVRTWTDATGKFKIEAKLLEFKDGKVKLERTDGKVVTLPFDKLSAADQFFVETKNP